MFHLKNTNGTGKKKKRSAGVRAVKQFTKKRIGKQLMIADAVLIALVGTTYVVNAQQYNHKFIEGTKINGMDVSEKTVEEVEAMLRPTAENYQLTLTFRDGAEETVSGDQIDLTYTPGNEVSEILNRQNSFSWIRGAFGGTEEHTVELPVSYSEEKLTAILSSLPEFQTDQMTAPVNASMQLNDSNRYEIQPETQGTQLHTDVAAEAVKTGISQLNPQVDLTAAEGVYDSPTMLSDNEALNQAVADANHFLDTVITYTDSSGNVLKTIDASVTRDFLTQDAGSGLVTVNPDTVAASVAAYVAQWAEADDNYGYFQTVKTTNYGNLEISSEELHGHTLNQEQLTAEMTADLNGYAGQVTHEISYSQYQDSPDTQLGGDYVEVDIDAQEVYVYQNYECVYSTSTVTGTESTSPTPSGIYSIYYRERNASLTGTMKEDGTPSYVSQVSYWMAFHGNYGLHDATWRDSFGGGIYKYSGSHGCVNLPVNAAKTIWNLTDYGTPVVVFRASNA